MPAPLPPDLGPAPPLRLAIVGLAIYGRPANSEAVASAGAAAARAAKANSDHCGIVGWCQGARRLRRVLPPQWNVTIALISHNNSRHNNSDVTERAVGRRGHACEGTVHVSADAALGRLAGACSRKTFRAWRGTPGVHGLTMPKATFLKWQLLSMDTYDALLFADLDVDLLPLESDATAVGSAWIRRLPAFVAADQPIVILANADHATPVKTL